MSSAIAEHGAREIVAEHAASSAAAITQALTPPPRDIEHQPSAAAHHVDRLWRLHGGDWNEPRVVGALVAGVAQLAWYCARRHGTTRRPPFALTLAAWPRCLRILLPDDSRHFGVVIVWLRHFEALLPSGAPPCHLVLPSRAGDVAMPRDGQWLWGDDAGTETPVATSATQSGLV